MDSLHSELSEGKERGSPLCGESASGAAQACPQSWRTMKSLQEWLEAVLSLFFSAEMPKKGNLINSRRYLKAGCKQNGARLCTVVPRRRTEREGQEKPTWKVPSEHQETLFYYEGD